VTRADPPRGHLDRQRDVRRRVRGRPVDAPSLAAGPASPVLGSSAHTRGLASAPRLAGTAYPSPDLDPAGAPVAEDAAAHPGLPVGRVRGAAPDRGDAGRDRGARVPAGARAGG